MEVHITERDRRYILYMGTVDGGKGYGLEIRITVTDWRYGLWVGTGDMD